MQRIGFRIIDRGLWIRYRLCMSVTQPLSCYFFYWCGHNGEIKETRH